VLQESLEFRPKRRVVSHLQIRPLELLDRLDERLRHESASEIAEVSPNVRIAS
jgi:hypothetical protein